MNPTTARRAAVLTLLVVAAAGSVATSAPEVYAALSGSAETDPVHLRLDSGASVGFEITAELELPSSADDFDLNTAVRVVAISEDEAGSGQLELYACDTGEELAIGEWAAPTNVSVDLPGALDLCEPGAACIVELCGLATATADGGSQFSLFASASVTSNEVMEGSEAGETFDIALTLRVDIDGDTDGDPE